MIIGKNRRQVILNIKKSVKEKNFNAKVEPNDPILSKKERLNLVKNFWANHDKLFSRIINLIARGILNVGTPILTFNTKLIILLRLRIFLQLLSLVTTTISSIAYHSNA